MERGWLPVGRLTNACSHACRYVAGNAGALAWRVNVTTGHWTKMWDKDVVDDSMPHGDCRNYAWDHADNRLVLVSDGGIFARESPREAGGKWVSLNGDYASMELLSAHYDWRGDRYVAGAQDNCAQVGWSVGWVGWCCVCKEMYCMYSG